jgi:regulator of sigma E protease
MRVAGRDRTEYVLAAIPLGGYVKMLDEREGPVPPEDLARSFTRRPHWQRIAVLLAGPAFNFAFAILLLTGMLLVSGSIEVRPIIGEVTADSPAARAGLRSGDEVLTIKGRDVTGADGVVLGLIDGISSDAPVVRCGARAGGPCAGALTSVRTANGGVCQIRDVMSGLGSVSEPPIPAVLGAVEPDGRRRARSAAGDGCWRSTVSRCGVSRDRRAIRSHRAKRCRC